MHWQVTSSGCKDISIVSVLQCEQRHSVSAAALGLVSEWGGGSRAGFSIMVCQWALLPISLGQVSAATPVGTCCGKETFFLHFLDRKLAKKT